MAALCDLDLQQSRIVRAIFRARELALGADADSRERPRGLLAWTRSMGWGLLAEMAGREVVMGAVTQPWNANVVFRPLPPDQFAAFREPGFVKIVWTLRADPLSEGGSIASTETRVMTTDAVARARFRRYWPFVSPGVVLIRRLALGLVRPTRNAVPSRRVDQPGAPPVQRRERELPGPLHAVAGSRQDEGSTLLDGRNEKRGAVCAWSRNWSKGACVVSRLEAKSVHLGRSMHN